MMVGHMIRFTNKIAGDIINVVVHPITTILFHVEGVNPGRMSENIRCSVDIIVSENERPYTLMSGRLEGGKANDDEYSDYSTLLASLDSTGRYYLYYRSLRA
jgi:hypothetical protein